MGNRNNKEKNDNKLRFKIDETMLEEERDSIIKCLIDSDDFADTEKEYLMEKITPGWDDDIFEELQDGEAHFVAETFDDKELTKERIYILLSTLIKRLCC